MGHYKLKHGVGKHYEPLPEDATRTQPVEPGGVIECSRDLAAIYPEKFEPVDAPAPPEQKAPAPAPKRTRGKAAPAPVPTPAQVTPPPAPSPAPTAADDVTAQFEVAAANGIIVRGSDANGFSYYEKDMPNEPINAVPMDRAGITAEITSYVS